MEINEYKINFKIYDVTTWETNNCNTHIAQYLNEILVGANSSPCTWKNPPSRSPPPNFYSPPPKVNPPPLNKIFML